MKIPTILALFLLVVAVGLGIFIFFSNQNMAMQKIQTIKPQQLQTLNITDTSFTVVWQTEKPSTGYVTHGTNLLKLETTKDDRDTNSPQKRLTHFVTVKNLTPETKYLYRIKIDSLSFPEEPIEVTTTKTLASNIQNQTIVGTVVDKNLQPLDEGLVFLSVNGSSGLASYVSTAGNFLLPLSQIRTGSYESYFQISSGTEANILIKKGDELADIKISLPLKNPTLPPVRLGQSLNFQQFSQLIESEKSSTIDPRKFDLNSDGKVNTLDLSTVLQNIGKNPKVLKKSADLNSDGRVDAKDVDLVIEALK